LRIVQQSLGESWQFLSRGAFDTRSRSDGADRRKPRKIAVLRVGIWAPTGGWLNPLRAAVAFSATTIEYRGVLHSSFFRRVRV